MKRTDPQVISIWLCMCVSYSILFYSILFYSILFYSIRFLFYSILFYSILFYSILFYSILFCSILFYSILFILFYSILFYSVLIRSKNVTRPLLQFNTLWPSLSGVGAGGSQPCLPGTHPWRNCEERLEARVVIKALN